MLFGKLNKLVDIRFNYVNATMHGWYAITLSLQSHTLSPDGAKASHSHKSSTTSMSTSKIATKNKNFVLAKIRDTFRSIFNIFRYK